MVIMVTFYDNQLHFIITGYYHINLTLLFYRQRKENIQ